MLTPQERHDSLGKKIGFADLYLKREDLNPYGSHKGRSIPVMIDEYVADGDRHFAISSSGNAALAAALHVKDFNDNRTTSDYGTDALHLSIFVGHHAAEHKVAKLKALEDEYIKVYIRERPLQALTLAAQEGTRSLRQSTDDAALKGYAALAEELSHIKDLGAIFIGTSSGTTAQALAAYFIAAQSPVQVHIIQTPACHPLSQELESYDGPEEETSLADAIVDKIVYRKDTLIPLIRQTGGNGWVATNDDIEVAQDMVKEFANLDISTNSALSIVGAMKAAEVGYDIKGAVICMICGD